MNQSNDYYTTIDAFRERNPEQITPLVICPKCGKGLKELHNLKADGTLRKCDKIIDLQCECGYLASEVKIPKQSMKKS